MRKQRNILFKRLGVTAIAVTLALCISAAVCIIAPASYRSSAILLVKPGQYVGADSNDAPGSFDRQQAKLYTLIELLLSREVVERAVDTFGAERLYPSLRSMDDLSSFTHNMRKLYDAWALGQSAAHLDEEPLRQKAVIRAMRGLDARPVFKGDMIAVSFSHPDPKVAADFTNALLSAFRSRLMELYTPSGADNFFSSARKRYDAVFEESSRRLSAFAIANDAYSIEEQRRLALERRNELRAAAVKTRSSIVEKQNQASETAVQISNLKPIAQYPQIHALAESVPKVKHSETVKATVMDLPNAASTPPLLLVKVYQDLVASLVQLRTDVAGLHALESHEQDEIAKVDAELRKLAGDEAEFDRLQLEVDHAQVDAQQYSMLAAKEHLSEEVKEKGLSIIEIAQSAAVPTRPSFPDPKVILPIGLGVGLLIGLWPLLLTNRWWGPRSPLESGLPSTAREFEKIVARSQVSDRVLLDHERVRVAPWQSWTLPNPSSSNDRP